MSQAGHSDEDIAKILQNALANDYIEPWFQPAMDPTGTRMLSAEALPRCEDPDHGVIAPMTFIAVAKSHGLLPAIGEVLLLKTCKAFAIWNERGIAPELVTINLTGDEMQNDGTVDRIKNALDAAGINPENLGIELAESTVYESGCEKALANIQKMLDLGVKIIADDLGSDDCDVENLRKMQASSAKVTRNIVMRLGESDEAEAKLRELSEITRSLDIPLIAKGVETRIQIDTLVSVGCEGQQGFAIARPMPEDSFTEWLDLNTGWGDAA